jgi:hypothetical protein
MFVEAATNCWWKYGPIAEEDRLLFLAQMVPENGFPRGLVPAVDFGLLRRPPIPRWATSSSLQLVARRLASDSARCLASSRQGSNRDTSLSAVMLPGKVAREAASSAADSLDAWSSGETRTASKRSSFAAVQSCKVTRNVAIRSGSASRGTTT